MASSNPNKRSLEPEEDEETGSPKRSKEENGNSSSSESSSDSSSSGKSQTPFGFLITDWFPMLPFYTPITQQTDKNTDIQVVIIF